MKYFIIFIFFLLIFSSCSKTKNIEISKIYFERTGCFNYSEKYLLIFESNSINIKKITSIYTLFPTDEDCVWELSFNNPAKTIRVGDFPNREETIKFVTIKRTDKIIKRINNLIRDYKNYNKTMGSTSNDKLVVLNKSNNIIINLSHYSKNEGVFNDSFLKVCEESFEP